MSVVTTVKGGKKGNGVGNKDTNKFLVKQRNIIKIVIAELKTVHSTVWDCCKLCTTEDFF